MLPKFIYNAKDQTTRIEEYGLTAEEISSMEAEQERAEAEYWKNISYGEAVSTEIRKRYTQDQVEAILNNYIAFPDDEEYIREFEQLQEYRLYCKSYVKEKKGEN